MAAEEAALRLFARTLAHLDTPAGTGLKRTSVDSVAPTLIFSFTVTGATFCVVTYCLILVRCSGANSTVAV